MDPVAASLPLGVLMHAIGACSAATCYAPQKRVRGWSWQTYWIVQAAFCWFLLPLAVAFLTIPHLASVLAAAPRGAMLQSFLLGLAYGVGGTAFGISIRYIGSSLTYAIAVGLSSVLGTLIPPLVKGTLAATLRQTGSTWIVAGISIGALGIFLTGWAGRLKENDLAARQGRGEFSLMKGLLLSLLAGVLSAVYGFALEAGEPIADVATRFGAGVFRGNVVYIFANTGAFLTTAVSCLALHARRKTWPEFRRPAPPEAAAASPVAPAQPAQPGLLRNYLLAALTGLLWYGQFFFYNLGPVRLGAYKFTSWAIHMIMLVLFSSLVGMAFREWRRCRRVTLAVMRAALLVLVGAVLLLTYGNYLGGLAAR